MIKKRHGTRKPTAVIVGMELGGLGVTRSLASAGIDVIAVDQERQKPEAFTRRVKKYVVADTKSPTLITSLLKLKEEFSNRPALITTQRLPTLMISEHREELEPYYRFLLAPHDLLLKMENKDALRNLAEGAGVRVPRTVVLTEEDSLNEAANLRFPCILKPADNNQAYMARFKKAYIIASYAELQKLVEEIWPYYQHLVVQEWISGPDSNIYFCLQYRDKSGTVLASFVGQKLCSWPPGTGATASCTRASKFTNEVQTLTDAFFNATGHVGFGSVEFKLDDKTGEFFLIEPTVGRTDQQEEVASLNGINIPYIGYKHLIGDSLPVNFPADTMFHVWQDTKKVKWAHELSGQPTQTIEDTLNGRIKIHDAYWRWSDPAPGLYSFWQRIAARIR